MNECIVCFETTSGILKHSDGKIIYDNIEFVPDIISGCQYFLCPECLIKTQRKIDFRILQMCIICRKGEYIQDVQSIHVYLHNNLSICLNTSYNCIFFICLAFTPLIFLLQVYLIYYI